MRRSFSIVAVAASAFYATLARAQVPAAQGRELVLKYCSACHGIERVQGAGATAGGWSERLERMNRWGAKVPPELVMPMANYLAAAFPVRPRSLSIDASVTTISVSPVAVHPVQTVVRIAGVLDADGKVIKVTLPEAEAALLAVGQRARAFRVSSRMSMYQGRVSLVQRRADRAAVEVMLSATVDTVERNYVMEIVTERGEFLAVPNEAILEEGERRLVYLQLPSNEYLPREIDVGIQGERYTQIVGGLSGGDQVVTLGSFFVDAEYRMKGEGDAGQGLTVRFDTDPNPPHSGENEFVTTVLENGAAVRNATVTVKFYMPAMPSMNMPEMHTDVWPSLQPDGTFRGTVNLAMSGTWNVTVMVSRNGQEQSAAEYTVIAK